MSSAFMNEVISYGGFPLIRADVYRLALEDTGSKKAADMFAFSPGARRLDCDPITAAEFRAETGGAA